MSNRDFDFSDEIDEANWKMLASHQERGAIFVVNAKLELHLVAKAMSSDDVNQIKAWLTQGDLRKPLEEEIKQWESDNESKFFLFIIVQPYVIIQLKPKTLQ